MPKHYQPALNIAKTVWADLTSDAPAPSDVTDKSSADPWLFTVGITRVGWEMDLSGLTGDSVDFQFWSWKDDSNSTQDTPSGYWRQIVNGTGTIHKTNDYMYPMDTIDVDNSTNAVYMQLTGVAGTVKRSMWGCVR